MINLKYLKEEIEYYKNTLVIGDFGNVVRLVDVVDGEDDYYWVYDTPNGIIHSSCVCKWIPLKGFLFQGNYERLVYVWNLNNVEKAI